RRRATSRRRAARARLGERALEEVGVHHAHDARAAAQVGAVPLTLVRDQDAGLEPRRQRLRPLVGGGGVALAADDDDGVGAGGVDVLGLVVALGGPVGAGGGDVLGGQHREDLLDLLVERGGVGG